MPWTTIVIALLVMGLMALGCFIYLKIPLAKKDELAKTISIVGGITAAI